MRREDLTRRFERDPLLKVGVGAMILALGFAIVVAFAAFLDRPIDPAAAKPEVKSTTTEPLVRSDPGVDPWVEKDIPPPEPEVTVDSRTVSGSRPDRKPDRSPDPETRSGGFGSGASGSGSAPPQQGSQNALPLKEDDYPLPTNEQLEATNHPRHYHLPPGAIMSLTIPKIDIQNAPVMNSSSPRALDQGVIHLPGTSYPWSDTQERNVYLAGHRLGWPGTGSHLIFYRLNQLKQGDRVTLRDREGTTYSYRVLESFKVGAKESWVTGRVKGRDLLTLQTCTPIPTFQWRLIVRAERI
jgi:sortase A